MKSGFLPSRLVIEDGLIPADFSMRLEAFKEDTGLSWDAFAGCLGVDPRQIQRWRKGTKPSGDGLCALILLAARIPGGLHTLLGIHSALPKERKFQPLLAGRFELQEKDVEL